MCRVPQAEPLEPVNRGDEEQDDDGHVLLPAVQDGELICYFDGWTSDPIFGLTNFDFMSARRVISFNGDGIPQGLSQDLVYTFSDVTLVPTMRDFWTTVLEERYPAAERGFALELGGTKADGSVMLSASGELNTLKDDTEAALFGLVPTLETNENGETVKVAYYDLETLRTKFMGQGWNCSVSNPVK